MSRPVCINCKREMTCFKTGMYVVHGYDDTQDDFIRGDMRCGDAFVCDVCGSRVAVGFGVSLALCNHPILPQDHVISLDGTFPPQNIPEKKS